MKGLVKTLALVSALSLWAGAAFGKIVELHCSTTKCVYNEHFGGGATKTLQGYCDGTQGQGQTNSGMVCHAVDGMTCTKATWVNSDPSHPYWLCSCTNWKTKAQNTTIDVTCPAP